MVESTPSSVFPSLQPITYISLERDHSLLHITGTHVGFRPFHHIVGSLVEGAEVYSSRVPCPQEWRDGANKYKFNWIKPRGIKKLDKSWQQTQILSQNS